MYYYCILLLYTIVMELNRTLATGLLLARIFAHGGTTKASIPNISVFFLSSVLLFQLFCVWRNS